jgi:hypothetical protein
MHEFAWAKIAVYFAKNDAYALGYREALDHAGIRYESIEELTASEIGRYHLLLLCGKQRLTSAETISITEWFQKGHALICSGCTWGLETILGLGGPTSHVSNGVMSPGRNDALWPEGADQIRFYGGTLKKANGCEVLAKVGEAVGIGRKRDGKCSAIYLAPHVGETLILMQYGRSVECDAIGPSDGSAVLDNGTLRAEDGVALDFDKDRRKTPGCETPFFAYPHSDAVKEMLIRAIVHSVEGLGLSTPILWHWPGGAKCAAMLSIDCQEFEREHVDTFHRTLAMFGTPAAWMVALPGYAVDTYRAMKAWDHEVGLLYLTDDQAGWNEEKFKMQWTALSRLSSQANLNSSRAVDGKWKGWKTFYDMCEVGGARISLSKGGRQAGTSGFLFGTSHPFIPFRRDGTPSLVTEIPYAVYSPGVVTPDAVCEELAAQADMRYGCLHSTCPSNAIANPEAAASLRRLLAICKQHKMEFVLPEEIHRFERGRRQLRIAQKLLDSEGTLVVSSDTEMPGMTVLINGPRLGAECRGKEMNVVTVQRYGCRFNMVVVDLEPKLQLELRFWPTKQSAAA